MLWACEACLSTGRFRHSWGRDGEREGSHKARPPCSRIVALEKVLVLGLLVCTHPYTMCLKVSLAAASRRAKAGGRGVLRPQGQHRGLGRGGMPGLKVQGHGGECKCASWHRRACRWHIRVCRSDEEMDRRGACVLLWFRDDVLRAPARERLLGVDCLAMLGMVSLQVCPSTNHGSRP